MLIKRKKLQELIEHLNQKEISLIVGPRQVGKTTLMNLLKDHVERNGGKTLFLSLDFETDKAHFVSQDALMRRIELEFGDKKGYVFIDEIQRRESAGLFLKGLYDMNLGHKFVVSGSGSVELKEKIHESLFGRKRIFELMPVSFEEFVDFRTDYRYEGRLDDFFAVESKKVTALLEEYLNFGGYPRVIIEKIFSEKIKILDEIYRSYVEKDIVYLLKVEKIDAFNSLMKILASQIGNLINYSEIANTLGIALPTVKNYLWYAEKTFMIKTMSPYFKNIRKEISKSPVVYFYDLGLRNYSLGIAGSASRTGDVGFLFQNLVYNAIREKIEPLGSLHFWRTKEKTEVDFIIDFRKEIIPLEVKYSDLIKPALTRSLRAFIDKYRPLRAFVVNKSLRAELTVGQTKIIFLPFQALLKEKLRQD